MSTLIEPLLGLLSDTGHRRRVILGGGGSFILALILFAAAPNFAVLLAATSLFYPASGAFVSVAQATWMDLEPTSTERNMGRWVLAGSIANVLGPVALLAAVALGSGWRAATLAAAIVSVPILISASRLSYPEPHPGSVDLRAALRGAIATIREREIIRWLTLLQLTDLLQDVFLGFVALYLVDVGQASPGSAALGVGILAAAGLIGDALLLPVLRRVDGIRYLRWSAAAALVAYPAFLLTGSVTTKLSLLIPIGILRAGWYSIPQARLYAALPGRGGTIVALGAPADFAGAILPLMIGIVAQRIGLAFAMWLLLAAPLALLSLLPRDNGDAGR